MKKNPKKTSRGHTAKTPAPKAKLHTGGLPKAQADRVAGEIVDNLLARSREKPSETAAAEAIARAWLANAGFHEDPTGDDPTRIEIQGPGWDGKTHEHYVDVRVYVPALDIDHVVDGTHVDGITVEAA